MDWIRRIVAVVVGIVVALAAVFCYSFYGRGAASKEEVRDVKVGVSDVQKEIAELNRDSNRRRQETAATTQKVEKIRREAEAARRDRLAWEARAEAEARRQDALIAEFERRRAVEANQNQRIVLALNRRLDGLEKENREIKQWMFAESNRITVLFSANAAKSAAESNTCSTEIVNVIFVDNCGNMTRPVFVGVPVSSISQNPSGGTQVTYNGMRSWSKQALFGHPYKSSEPPRKVAIYRMEKTGTKLSARVFASVPWSNVYPDAAGTVFYLDDAGRLNRAPDGSGWTEDISALAFNP